MSLFDRVILTLYTFAMAFVSGIFVVIALGWHDPISMIENAFRSVNGRWLMGLAGAAFFIVSVRLILLAFRRRSSSQSVVHETNLGEVRISLDAVESLVNKVARQVKGVREVKADVDQTPAGITVALRGTVAPDVSIPDVSNQIQSDIRNSLQRVVGVGVGEIRIYVENIASEARRVR